MSVKRLLLEVAIASAEDAATATAGGADRVELNTALALGGLSPSRGLVTETRAATSLPLIVMARPRVGGFCYSAVEFRVLRRDCDNALEQGADGIAFGVLHADGTIDVPRCREIVQSLGSAQAVFHRAFDVTPDPLKALSQLLDLGIHRVMSSGQQVSACDGSALLKQLIETAQGEIEILPAGGINGNTVADVVQRTGCTQVHGSLRGWATDPSTRAQPLLRFGSQSGPEDRYEVTSLTEVQHMRELLDRLSG